MNMKLILIVLVSFSVAAAAGCVPSAQPFYTENDVAFNTELLGSWKDKGAGRWTFSRSKNGGKDRYDIVITTKTGASQNTVRMLGTVMRIKGATYLDMFPGDPKQLKNDVGLFWLSHVVPVHTLWKLERINDTVNLNPMNPFWLKKYLKDNPREIAFAEFDGVVVLTATTEKLQAFVNKHIRTKGAFRSPIVLIKQ